MTSSHGIRHSNRVQFVFMLLALFAWIAAPLRAVTPPTRPSVPHTPFVTVLLRDWDRWDTNHDGVLSVAEIDRAVLDPMVTGDDAAVAGTLKLLSRSTTITVPPLTRQYFLDYDRRAKTRIKPITPVAAEAATTDVVKSNASPTTAPAPTTAPVVATAKTVPVINWDVYFVAGKKRITRGGRVAWPDEINLDDLRQGPLGDCFLVASIGSMVVHRPADVKSIIKPEPDGGFVINLPGTDSFRLRPLTQSELVISSTSSGEGAWLAALEQAFGKYRATQKGGTAEEGTDVIAGGGLPGPTISILTGHRYARLYFATTAARRQEERAKMLPILRADLIDALKNNRLITADVTPPTLVSPTTRPATRPADRLAIAAPTTRPATTRPATTRPATTRPATSRPVLTAAMLPKIPPDINIKHAYAVVGYDEKTDMLEIWNPHGQTFKPKGPAGLENGYATEHGRFHVPLSEAYAFFSSFCFETADPDDTRPGPAKVVNR